MLSTYLITGSEHKGDAFLNMIKDYLLSQNLQQEAHRTKLLKFIGTLQERNPSTCMKPDTERQKRECKRSLHEFHDV